MAQAPKPRKPAGVGGSGRIRPADVRVTHATVHLHKKNLDVGGGGHFSGQYQEYMFALAISGDKVDELFKRFVEELWRIIHLEDIESFGEDTASGTNALDVMQHVGLTKGGVCFLRVAQIVYDELQQSAPARELKMLYGMQGAEKMARDPSTPGRQVSEDEDMKMDLNSFVAILMKEAGGTGLDGFSVLQMLAEHEDVMSEVAAMIRSHSIHPSRTILLHEEGDFEEAAGDLRERAAKADIHVLQKALDSFLCILLLQARPNSGWQALRTAPPGSQHSGHAIESRDWSFEDLERNIIGVIWEEVDVDADDRLDADECRELLRLILSRPAFSCTAREWLVNAQPEAEHMKEAALSCCTEAVMQIAPMSKDVARSMWLQMDEDDDGCVTAAEFREMFGKSIKVAVLDLVVEKAAELLSEQYGEQMATAHMARVKEDQDMPQYRVEVAGSQAGATSERGALALPAATPTPSARGDAADAPPELPGAPTSLARADRRPTCTIEWFQSWFSGPEGQSSGSRSCF